MLRATYPSLSFLLFYYLCWSTPLRVAVHSQYHQLCITLKHNKVKLYPFPLLPTPKPFSFPPLGPTFASKIPTPIYVGPSPFFILFSFPISSSMGGPPHLPSPNSFFILFIIRHSRHDYFTTELSTTTQASYPSFLLSFVTLLFLRFLSIIFSLAFFSQSASSITLVVVKVVYYVMYTGPLFFFFPFLSKSI